MTDRLDMDAIAADIQEKWEAGKFDGPVMVPQAGPAGIIEDYCKQVVQFEGESTDVSTWAGTTERGMGELALRASQQLENIVNNAPDENRGKMMNRYIDYRLELLRERFKGGETLIDLSGQGK